MNTRKCRTCGQTKEKNAINFVPVTKKLMNGDTGHYFTTNCRLCYNLNQRDKDLVNNAVKKPLKHTGPIPGTPEHTFFCT